MMWIGLLCALLIIGVAGFVFFVMLNQLVKSQLELLTKTAGEAIASREKVIRETHEQLRQDGQRAKEAVEGFKTDFGTVTAQIGSLQGLQKQVSELNDLLKPQQFRGELGEFIVRNLIADKLPAGHYKENHSFTDGKQVEFVIQLNDRFIPVDSKLPLDNFKRMRDSTDDRQRQTLRTEFKRIVKNKIDEVKQYIKPDEGTYKFALMVIPSEAVYYDLVAHKDFAEPGGLFDYARERNVFLTSPSTFWAYLTAIAHGLRGLEIERQAEQILLHLETLTTKIRNFSQDEFRKLGTHLKNASNQYDESERTIREIDEGLGSLEQVKDKALTA